MSGTTGITGRSNWLEQSLPDGRKYWYNMSTTQSVWEEPAELAASRQTTVKAKVLMNSDIVSSWREILHANGRKYYYNAVTKVTMWEMPPDYAEYLERMRDPTTLDKQTAELKFMAMLKEKGMTSRFSWEEALREIINHPHYKLVPTLAERKALFAKHIQIQKEVEREERLQRAAMDREDFKAMLRSKGVTSTTRYREVMDRLAEEPAFKAIESSKERTTLFEDFIDELRREESEASRTRKRRAVEKFEKLLLNLSEIRLDTSWKTAIDIINRQPEMRSDADLASMEPIEQLIGYENYIKGLERIEQQREIEQRDERHKRQRLNRKAFKALLDEMQIKGYLKATTSWSEFYSFIKGRSELISMLAQPGSTPLDLFWDRIHEMQEKYIVQVKPAFEELKNLYGEDWYIKVTIDDIKRTSEKLDIPTDIVEAIKAHLLPLSRKELVEEKRDTAAITAKVDALRNNNRKLVDRLKHAIKHFDPPITLQSTYEEYRSLLVAHPDIVEVTDDDVRWYYFNKYIRHLRKRAGFEDGNSEEEGEERGGNRIKSSRPHH